MAAKNARTILALTVACTACGVAAGKACTAATGKLASAPHGARLKAAQAARAENHLADTAPDQISPMEQTVTKPATLVDAAKLLGKLEVVVVSDKPALGAPTALSSAVAAKLTAEAAAKQAATMAASANGTRFVCDRTPPCGGSIGHLSYCALPMEKRILNAMNNVWGAVAADAGENLKAAEIRDVVGDQLYSTPDYSGDAQAAAAFQALSLDAQEDLLCKAFPGPGRRKRTGKPAKVASAPVVTPAAAPATAAQVPAGKPAASPAAEKALTAAVHRAGVVATSAEKPYLCAVCRKVAMPADQLLCDGCKAQAAASAKKADTAKGAATPAAAQAAAKPTRVKDERPYHVRRAERRALRKAKKATWKADALALARALVACNADTAAVAKLAAMVLEKFDKKPRGKAAKALAAAQAPAAPAAPSKPTDPLVAAALAQLPSAPGL